MWCPSRIDLVYFGVSQKSWLSDSLTVSPAVAHQVLMSLSSLDQAEDDEDCRKWVVRGVAKMLQKVGDETMTSQHHSDNLSG